MNNTNELRKKLENSPNTYNMWPDDVTLPPCFYALEGDPVYRIDLMFRGDAQIYFIYFQPTDIDDIYDTYLSKLDVSCDMVFMFRVCAKDPKDAIEVVLESLPDYLLLM